MSTYYYLTCKKDRTRVFFATSNMSGPLRIREEVSEWLKEHILDDIQMTTEHDDELIYYKEVS